MSGALPLFEVSIAWMYGEQFEVNIQNQEPGGVEVSISVPLEQPVEHS